MLLPYRFSWSTCAWYLALGYNTPTTASNVDTICILSEVHAAQLAGTLMHVSWECLCNKLKMHCTSNQLTLCSAQTTLLFWFMCCTQICQMASYRLLQMPDLLMHLDVVMYRYGTYQMIQKAAGGDRHVAFTRILHRSEPDILMTQVAYPSHAPSACINVVCLADSANRLC